MDENEVFGWVTPDCKYCKTCMYSKGKPPFADEPTKGYCLIYTRESGQHKPSDIMYKGKKCTFYEAIEN